MNFCKKQKFTLIEMLVVISIIAILASLLMPALQSSISTAKTLSCSSNMKQLSVCHQLYIDDFNSWIVPAELRDESHWSGTWIGWAGIFTGLGYINPPRTYTYSASRLPVSAASVLKCPEGSAEAFCPTSVMDLTSDDMLFPKAQRILGAPYTGSESNVNVWYGNNGSNQTWPGHPNWRVAPDDDKFNKNRYTRLSNISSPSSTVSNFDGAWSVLYGSKESKQIFRRHNQNGSVNLLFWDGHSQTVGEFEVPPLTMTSWSVSALNNWNPKIKWKVNQ